MQPEPPAPQAGIRTPLVSLALSSPRGGEDAADIRQAGVRAGDSAGLVIPRDRTRLLAAQHVGQR